MSPWLLAVAALVVVGLLALAVVVWALEERELARER